MTCSDVTQYVLKTNRADNWNDNRGMSHCLVWSVGTHPHEPLLHKGKKRLLTLCVTHDKQQTKHLRHLAMKQSTTSFDYWFDKDEDSVGCRPRFLSELITWVIAGHGSSRGQSAPAITHNEPLSPRTFLFITVDALTSITATDLTKAFFVRSLLLSLRAKWMNCSWRSLARSGWRALVLS